MNSVLRNTKGPLMMKNLVASAVVLAVLASLAASRTDDLTVSGEGALAALNSGYHVAFLVGAIFVAASAVVGGVLLRAAAPAPHGEGQPATEAA